MIGTIEKESTMYDAMIAQLRDTSAYRHSVEGPVVVHETHISLIFLAGHFAYKIKKPITTDFLDYGTLAKRHHACCEELRLDSRYADGLYLEVVPITFEDGHVLMDGDAQPIEFALRMRRFPEDSLLSERIHAGHVGMEEMVQLANTIAIFHRRATVSRELEDLAFTQIRDQSTANFTSLRSLLPSGNQDRSLLEVEEWTNQSITQLQSLFRHRVREGFIRECHGDLHCDNIVYWHDQWAPFDGIEFNPQYSWIDVLSDVAFLVMDLQHRGRPDLSACFLNTYLEQTGDHEALPLLRWYMVYRALVRAKVSMLRSEQTTEDASQHARCIDMAKLLLSLSHQLIQPNPRRLWITHGVSGSGKTTGSQQLVNSEAAVRLRSDIERKRLFGKTLAEHQTLGVGQGMYSATASEMTYQILLMKTRNILQAGFSVVVDATFLTNADRHRFQALAEAENAYFQILDFRAEEGTLRQRIIDRSLAHRDASDANLAVLNRQLTSQEPLTADELKHTRFIDEAVDHDTLSFVGSH